MKARNRNKKRKQTRTVNEVQLVYTRPILEGAKRIKTSADAISALRAVYDHDRIDLKEFFYVILLSRYNQVLGVAPLSIGSVSGTVVSVSEIVQLALLRNASGIVLSHNHPSGSLVPSGSDRILTHKIVQACKLFDIAVLDHVIVTSESYYSFADNREL